MISPKNKEIDITRFKEIVKNTDIATMLRVQHRILLESREILHKQGFYEFLAPVIGPATDPGIRGAKRVSFDYYGHRYKIMSSIILYKQALIRALPKVYAFSPNIRLEPLSNRDSSRHLCEFYQLDFEISNGKNEDVIEETEKYLTSLISRIREACGDTLKKIGRKLRVPSRPFQRIPYKRIIDIADSFGYEIEYGKEIPWQIEEILSKERSEPFWITDYPDGSRGFYYRQDPDRPELLRSIDLIYPEGFGEAASGGERETDIRRIRELMKRTGENEEEYMWYLTMLEEDGKPSAGLGIGVERLTRFILGYKDIKQCTAFPKKPGYYTI